MPPVTAYVALLLVAAGLSAGLAVSAWRRRGVPGAVPLAAMLQCTFGWCLSYALELVGGDVPTKLLWAQFEYLGIVGLPLTWLVFALQYTGYGRWLRGKLAWLLALEPALTLLVILTNPVHGLFWREIELDSTGPFPALRIAHGPWFWGHSAYSYVLLLISAALLAWAVWRSPQLFRRQVVAVLIAILTPWLANALYIFSLNPVPHLDLTPFAATIAGLSLAWGLMRLRLLKSSPGIVPVARDATLLAMTDGVIVLDRADLIADLNPAARRILGPTTANLIGQPFETVLAGRLNLPEFGASQPNQEVRAEVAIGEASQRRDYDLLLAPLRGSNGGQYGRLAVLRDITERKRAERALQHQALHDTLTDLPNRDQLQARLQQATRQTEREQRPHALLLMDVDRFKEINDTFGHDCGDLLLRQVGARLSEALRGSDLIARLGGDEFAVLLEGTEGEEAVRVTRQILRSLERPFVVNGYRLDVGVSIGIALCPTHSSDPITLLRRADVAMYAAKRRGDGYSVYTTEQDPYNPERLELLGDLRLAIERRELTLHYQPQVSFRYGQLVQVEALARWQHPRRGLLFPADFIPLAEQTGLMKPLTLCVLESALDQCREWCDAGWRLPVAVNLSARSLHDPELAAGIAAALARSGVAPTNLEVEITESSLMEDPAKAVESVEALSRLGVRVGVDDFGTGYSSLAYLARLPVDELKIDKSFVLRMATAATDAAIVRSTINLGHDLGLTVVAEGVEDQRTWDSLVGLGCDVAQGYHLSRPLPAPEIAEWLQRLPERSAALLT